MQYTGLVFKMAIIIGLGVYGGMKIDEYQGNKTPGWTIALSLLSIVVAMRQVIKDVSK